MKTLSKITFYSKCCHRKSDGNMNIVKNVNANTRQSQGNRG